MEITIPNNCIKCGNGLTKEEKKIGLPICQKCTNSLLEVVKDKIQKSEMIKYEDNVEDFSKFILSSGGLFRLDEIVIIQSTFNIFMNKTTEFANKNPAIVEKIYTDSIDYIEKELDNINNGKGQFHGRMSNNRFVSVIDELINNDEKIKKDSLN